jgi:hypothetical protein
MGITIHYSGRFNPKASLPEMVEEVKDIVIAYEWPYHIFETEFPVDSLSVPEHNHKLYGISFTPPESETVNICFLSNGRISGPAQLNFYGNSANEIEQEYLYMQFVKTQFAGWQIHIVIVRLLQYVFKKYLLEVKVNDEGGYWDTHDEDTLKENFRRNGFLIESFTAAIESFPIEKGESLEAYLLRMAEWVKKR